MQINYLPKNVYRFYAWARTQECLDAYRQRLEASVRHWQELRAAGVSAAQCPSLAGISRATYYRRCAQLERLKRGHPPPSKAPRRRNRPRWGERERQQVLEVRRANPTYGKAKIAVILRRDYGAKLSESTVGRILRVLRDKHLITRSKTARTRRRRDFSKGHASCWHFKKYADMALGERVQIDHMSVTKNGVHMKHFQAWERRSKHIHAQIYSNAKATSARKFLRELVASAPYPILSIQVDGGSEFRAEFERECEKLAIPLEVLPPAKPKLGGGVERGNRIFREEFYDDKRIIADSIGALRFELRQAVNKYNTFRPHFALKGHTPCEYIRINHKEAA